MVGNIDELAIWSGTDLRNDVATIYNNGEPTDLNNNGLTAPTTWQRMGDNATWNGATWTMTDVNGGYTNRSINMAEANRTTDVPPNPFVNTQSILLDGVDDYVDTSTINIDNTNGTTLSLWLKGTNGVGGGLITSRGSIGGSDSLLNFDVKSDGRLFSRRFGSSSYTGLTGLRDGTWKHLLITLNYSTGDVKYYLNGVQGGNTDNYGNIYSNNILNSIGRGGALYFGGNIDEVSVFKKVLTSTEISQVYNNGIPNDISSLNPFSWWRFEGSGTTATDSGSGGNNGTLTNGVVRSTDVPT